VTWLNHLQAMPITIGMTLFPSAFGSDRPWVMGALPHPLRGLRNVVKHLLARSESVTTPVLSVVTSNANGTRNHRPEPRLKWTDRRRAPDGDFAASAILNVELASTGVPRRGNSWDVVSDFALSYDGYGYWDDLHELANRVLQSWTRSRVLPATIDELRGCLFYEQRRWHHFGEDPAGRSAEYMWAMIDAIAALCAPVTGAMNHLSDPRPTAARETHVTLLATPQDASEHVTRRRPTLRPLTAGIERLVPVAAAEAHVRLMSTIEDGAMSRHPSAHSSRRSPDHPSAHPSTQPPAQPSMQPSERAASRGSKHASSTIRDLRPMPSAEPLPKPPVIVRRSREASGAPNRPGGAANATRQPKDAHPSNGARRRLEPGPGPSGGAPASVTPLCHEFCDDDSGYLAWVASHPQGYVLNQPRMTRPKAPTLHRVGCAAVAPRDGVEALTAGTVKVCGPSADALQAWSMAQGADRPTACRRCDPLKPSP